ncbi:hypothetical protein ACFYTC_22775, partial [Actinomadura nitritigenes]|uniref:hypothetical protein n=1 Tax=Actinomadura nitritigenes TaxID=134602 RepID=UPI0036B14846
DPRRHPRGLHDPRRSHHLLATPRPLILLRPLSRAAAQVLIALQGLCQGVGLCRDLMDIHAVRDWCRARSVVPQVLSGPLSNFHDLAADDATTALIINVITAVGQFLQQRSPEDRAEEDS